MPGRRGIRRRQSLRSVRRHWWRHRPCAQPAGRDGHKPVSTPRSRAGPAPS